MIPTRQSLLARLKDWGDQASWREFFDSYWRLIHATALKAGLTESEAEEVVQEVMIAAAKKMPGFTYDPGKDSLKGWLLAVTRWKVADQFRKREKVGQPCRLPGSGETPDLRSDSTSRTATVERAPDPKGIYLDVIVTDAVGGDDFNRLKPERPYLPDPVWGRAMEPLMSSERWPRIKLAGLSHLIHWNQPQTALRYTGAFLETLE